MARQKHQLYMLVPVKEKRRVDWRWIIGLVVLLMLIGAIG